MKTHLFILATNLLQFGLVLTEECHRETKFVLIQQDGKPLINPIKTVTASDSFSCSTACISYQGCYSFAFLSKTSVDNCKLSNNVDGVSVSHGVVAKVYKKIANATKGCAGNPCQKEVRCVDLHHVPYHQCFPAKHCKELYDQGEREDGVYFINPDEQGLIDVTCDMTTDGGGWTVFQTRFDGSVDFYRGWVDYKIGFGDTSAEFWLGFDKIRRIMHSEQHSLRIELEDFDANTRYAKYSQFTIGDESTKYKLTVSGFSGNVGDSLAYHSGRMFSTKDRDNDAKSGSNCAIEDEGAWWYNNCNRVNLNGVYYSDPSVTKNKGLQWQHWKGDYYSLKKAEMKLRPN